MPIRTWLYVSTLGLALATSGKAQDNIADPEPQPVEAQTQSANESPDPPSNIVPSIAAPANPASADHEYDASADGDYEPYQVPQIILGDGWAQWVMAFLAFCGVLISAWAVWLLRQTLKATIIAIGEGEKAAEAALLAVEQAKEANKIMRDEQRPWIKFDPQVKFSSSHGIMCVKIVLPFQNVGVRPAQAVRVMQNKIDDLVGREAQQISSDLIEVADFARNFVSTEGVVFPNDRSKRGGSIRNSVYEA
jgi:hypothetical protein